MHAYKVTQKMKDPRHIVFMFSNTLLGMKDPFQQSTMLIFTLLFLANAMQHV